MDTQTLVEQAQSGDKEALEELIALHRPELERHVQHLLGADLRERVRPQDVLQETVLGALRSLDGFQWQGELSLGTLGE